MEPKRTQFTFYFSFYDALAHLSKEQRGEVMWAIAAYAMLGEYPELDGPSMCGFKLIRPVLDAAEKKAAWLLGIWLAACTAGLCALSLPGGIAAALIAAGCFFGLRRMAAREFGGMSGDLAGYIITLSQLLMLLGYVFAERMAEVWF